MTNDILYVSWSSKKNVPSSIERFCNSRRELNRKICGQDGLSLHSYLYKIIWMDQIIVKNILLNIVRIKIIFSVNPIRVCFDLTKLHEPLRNGSKPPSLNKTTYMVFISIFKVFRAIRNNLLKLWDEINPSCKFLTVYLCNLLKYFREIMISPRPVSSKW